MFRSAKKKHLNSSESITNCESINSIRHSNFPSICSSPLHLSKKKEHHFLITTNSNSPSINEKIKTLYTSGMKTPHLIKQLSQYVLFTRNANKKTIMSKASKNNNSNSHNIRLQDIFFDKSRQDKYTTSEFPFKTMQNLTKRLIKDFSNYNTKTNLKLSRNNYHDTLNFLDNFDQINKQKALVRESTFMKTKFNIIEDIKSTKDIKCQRRSSTLKDLIFNEKVHHNEESNKDEGLKPEIKSNETISLKINKSEQLKIKSVERKMKEIKLKNRNKVDLSLFFNDNQLKKHVESHNNIQAIKNPSIDNDNMNMDEYQNVKALKVLLKEMDDRKIQLRTFDLPRFMKSNFKSKTNMKFNELSGLNFY